MILCTSLSDYLRLGALDLSKTIYIAIYFAIAGPIVGLVSWWSNEGEFKAAKIDARMREIRQQSSIHRGDV